MNKYHLTVLVILFLTASCTSIQIQETLDDIRTKSSQLLHEQGIVVKNDYSKIIEVSPYRTNTPDKQASSISISLNNSVFHNPEANLRTLVEALLKGVDDPVRQVKILHDWIALNISYDAFSFSRGVIPEQSYSSVLKARKAVCDGYSSLFLQMCTLAKIKCHKLSGYARAVEYDPLSPEISSQTNHAWNAVFINGNWYLVDVTWDAGYVKGKGTYSFVKRYTTEYFLLEPSYIIHTHFPESPMWQLLPTKLTKNDFYALPYFTGDFFDSVVTTEPVLTSMNKASDTATLKLIVKDGNRISAHLSDSQGIVLKSATLVTLVDGVYQIQMSFPKSGLYSLQLYSGKKGKTLSSIGEIVYSVSSGLERKFPEQYESSVGSSYKLLSPESGYLKVNTEAVFRLYIPNRQSAYISYNHELIPMNATSDGIFTLSMIPIKKGEKLLVMLPLEGRKGSYETILSYTIIE